MLKRVEQLVRRINLRIAVAAAIVSAATLYALAFLDPYVALIMAPFFALGCSRGKHPLTLLALSLLPAFALLAVSALKFYVMGMPLVASDHYLLQRNVLMLAYNDWRVSAALIVTTAATVLYFRHLFLGRGAFSRFEKWCLATLVLASSYCLVAVQRWDSNLLNWETKSKPPTLETLVRSSQIPRPHLHVLAEAAASVSVDKGIGRPAGPLPDIFFILEESTLPPAVLHAAYAPQTLFAKNAFQTGPLRVHTWAGGTWKTEFSVTTQMRPQEFGDDGIYVFHQLEGRIKRSIFTELKALGYRTVVVNPVPGFFINAKPFYTSIGVDEFYDPESLGLGVGWSWKTPDATLYEAMLKKIGDSPAPVVVLMLTINQHGPHDIENPIGDYVARFAESDRAYGAFLTALEQRGRKAGVVAFGDHQPEFTARFIEDQKKWYFTAYDIRCVNFACAKTTALDTATKPLDVVMLSPMALEEFGFSLDDLSLLQRKIFHDCTDDIERCDEAARMKFNTAFAQFFD